MKNIPQITLEKRLEKYLLEHIPISAAMGVKVDKASSTQMVLEAPFANNINHKKTVFGGSLHAVATLACWSLLHYNLTERLGDAVQIVIANSKIDYLSPVTMDFKAECCLPDSESWDYFLKALDKKNKARVNLQAQIYQDGKLCVDYVGTFVAINTA
jgi:thioesterase domain-containing protein